VSFGIKERYYCINVKECGYAARDHPYSEQEFRHGKGSCVGLTGDGCQSPLVLGDPLDRRALLFTVGLLGLLGVAGGALELKYQLFPDPLQHIAFSTVQSRTPDSVGLLTLTVTRSAQLDRQQEVQYGSTDGTAKAGEDYQASQGTLVFGPGEKEKHLDISILPDKGYQKADRYFTITLKNVAETPRHVVFIEQRRVDTPEQERVAQVVRTASVVAMDIAADVVRQRALSDLVSRSREDPAAYQQFKSSLDTVEGNLTRAREHYLQLFKDMQGMQPSVVMAGMEAVSAQQAHEGYRQQSLATAVMKRQLQEFLNSNTLSMDRWAQELGGIIPRPPDKETSAST